MKKQQLIKKLNTKDKIRGKAYLWAKRSSVIICKFCETKIPIWENPEYCPNCLDGKKK